MTRTERRYRGMRLTILLATSLAAGTGRRRVPPLSVGRHFDQRAVLPIRAFPFQRKGVRRGCSHPARPDVLDGLRGNGGGIAARRYCRNTALRTRNGDMALPHRAAGGRPRPGCQLAVQGELGTRPARRDRRVRRPQDFQPGPDPLRSMHAELLVRRRRGVVDLRRGARARDARRSAPAHHVRGSSGARRAGLADPYRARRAFPQRRRLRHDFHGLRRRLGALVRLRSGAV